MATAGGGSVFVTPLPAAPAAPAAATHTLFVRLLVRPGTGQLEQKRRTLALNATWTEVFDAIKAEGRHVGAMGALMKVEASFPPPIGDSEVDESEAVSDVLTCERVTLIAHQPGLERAAPRVPQLAREAVRSIPPFMHLGRKNLSNCYEGLVKMIEGEPAPRSLGFLSAESVGKKWMVDLNDIVFHTSPFHSKMASRGFRVQKAFNFAANTKVLEGADVEPAPGTTTRPFSNLSERANAACTAGLPPFQLPGYLQHLVPATGAAAAATGLGNLDVTALSACRTCATSPTATPPPPLPRRRQRRQQQRTQLQPQQQHPRSTLRRRAPCASLPNSKTAVAFVETEPPPPGTMMMMTMMTMVPCYWLPHLHPSEPPARARRRRPHERRRRCRRERGRGGRRRGTGSGGRGGGTTTTGRWPRAPGHCRPCHP